MAKQLKTTGLAATALMWVAVDPDTGTIKDFASSAVTAAMTVGANVTVGDITWDGITQKYFRNGAGTTDADFIKFGATKPSWAVNSTTPQRTYVALVQIENTTTRVFGTNSTNYFFSRDSGSGGDTYPRLYLSSNAFTAGLPPPSVGAKVMFGFRVNRSTACGWFEADDTDSSLNTGSQAIGAVDSTWSLDYLCRRNDSTSNTRGYFVAVGVFDGLPSDAQLLALLDDPSGYMLESAGGDASASGVTLTATASLITGSASGSSGSTASGVTLTATASLIAGAATGSGNATASGVTLTATGSLIPGSASGVINGVLSFQAAGMEFGARTGVGIDTFALDAGVSYRYSVHADGLTLGSAILTSAAITLDGAGKLPNLVSSLLTPGTTYRVFAIRQTDGEAATFRLTAS